MRGARRAGGPPPRPGGRAEWEGSGPPSARSAQTVGTPRPLVRLTLFFNCLRRRSGPAAPGVGERGRPFVFDEIFKELPPLAGFPESCKGRRARGPPFLNFAQYFMLSSAYGGTNLPPSETTPARVSDGKKKRRSSGLLKFPWSRGALERHPTLLLVRLALGVAWACPTRRVRRHQRDGMGPTRLRHWDG